MLGWFTFSLTTRLLYVFTFSLGGSTEPPLDPPQADQACGDRATVHQRRFLPLIRAAVKTVKHSSAHRSYIKRKTTIHLGGTTYEQTVIWKQLFAGHVGDSRPMKINCLGKSCTCTDICFFLQWIIDEYVPLNGVTLLYLGTLSHTSLVHLTLLKKKKLFLIFLQKVNCSSHAPSLRKAEHSKKYLSERELFVNT